MSDQKAGKTKLEEIRERDAAKGFSGAGITMLRTEADRRWLLARVTEMEKALRALVDDGRNQFVPSEHGYNEDDMRELEKRIENTGQLYERADKALAALAEPAEESR